MLPSATEAKQWPNFLAALFLGGVAGWVYLWILLLAAVVLRIDEIFVDFFQPPPWVYLAAVPAGALGAAIRKALLWVLIALIVIIPFAVAYTEGDAAHGYWRQVIGATVLIVPAGALGGAVGRLCCDRLGSKGDATWEEMSQFMRFLDRFLPRSVVKNWFLGLAISSCVLLVTGYFYPPTKCGQSTQPLQAVVWLSVIAEIFLLRLLGFRVEHMVIPLIVLLGMMLHAESASFSPHSGWAFIFVIGFYILVFSAVVILAEAIGRATRR